MALISCPHCGKQISDKAALCPHCGLPFATRPTHNETEPSGQRVAETINEKRHKKWPIYVIYGLCLTAVMAILWVFVIDGALGNSNKTPESKEIIKTTDPNTLDSNVPIPNNSLNNVSYNRFLTQDLRMWGLFGPVRDFRISVSSVGNSSRQNEEILRIQYDSQGHFSNTIDGVYTTKEIAKKDGDRIIEAKRCLGEFGCITKQWSYYPDGMVKQSEFSGYENYESCQYFYNETSELLKTETTSAAEGTNYKTTVTYTIKERDNYGNWTVRLAEITDQEYVVYGDGHEEYHSSVTRNEIHNRTINYYGQKTTGQFVVIDATELRLRLGPSTSAGILKWGDGTERYPNKGEKYLYLGESGDFYKIDYKGQELWVSKKYTYLE